MGMLNLGRHNGIVKFIKDWANSPIFAIYYMVYRLELAIGHLIQYVGSMKKKCKQKELKFHTPKRILPNNISYTVNLNNRIIKTAYEPKIGNNDTSIS